MSDWIELKDLQAVAKAQADGWEIEVSPNAFQQWRPWLKATWRSDDLYRGRPKAERKVVQVRECVIQFPNGGTTVRLMNEAEVASYGRDFKGWVKGSEWREVEYE